MSISSLLLAKSNTEQVAWGWPNGNPADVGHLLTGPPEVAITNQRSDLVLWSNSQCRVYFVELTVPWEDAGGEAFKVKKLRYSDLAEEAEQRGWRAKVCPGEAGSRGSVATSAVRLMKNLGISAQVLRQAIKELAKQSGFG